MKKYVKKLALALLISTPVCIQARTFDAYTVLTNWLNMAESDDEQSQELLALVWHSLPPDTDTRKFKQISSAEFKVKFGKDITSFKKNVPNLETQITKLDSDLRACEKDRVEARGNVISCNNEKKGQQQVADDKIREIRGAIDQYVASYKNLTKASEDVATIYHSQSPNISISQQITRLKSLEAAYNNYNLTLENAKKKLNFHDIKAEFGNEILQHIVSGQLRLFGHLNQKSS
jgi:hypothetical protein